MPNVDVLRCTERTAVTLSVVQRGAFHFPWPFRFVVVALLCGLVPHTNVARPALRPLAASPQSNLQVASPALRVDFNGDGRSDMVWQNADGSTALWLMDGLGVISGGGLLGPGTG